MAPVPLLRPRAVLTERFEVDRKIGEGTFSEIYRALDRQTNELVAIKVEKEDRVLKWESSVQKRLQDCPYVCRHIIAGEHEARNYLAMELLGDSLSDLRRRQPEGKLSMATTALIGVQLLKAIQGIHELGYINRDIKPSNFCMGLGTKDRQCFMVDFGLAKKYRDAEGRVNPARPVAEFRGTSHYASINAHKNKELGRRDDLWSLLYVLVEFLEGDLPWRSQTNKEKVLESKEFYNKNPDRLLRSTATPMQLQDFAKSLSSLEYEDDPDYTYLLRLLESLLEELGVQPETLFDWEARKDVRGAEGEAPSVAARKEPAAAAPVRELSSQAQESGEISNALLEVPDDGKAEVRTEEGAEAAESAPTKQEGNEQRRGTEYGRDAVHSPRGGLGPHDRGASQADGDRYARGRSGEQGARPWDAGRRLDWGGEEVGEKRKRDGSREFVRNTSIRRDDSAARERSRLEMETLEERERRREENFRRQKMEADRAKSRDKERVWAGDRGRHRGGRDRDREGYRDRDRVRDRDRDYDKRGYGDRRRADVRDRDSRRYGDHDRGPRRGERDRLRGRAMLDSVCFDILMRKRCGKENCRYRHPARPPKESAQDLCLDHIEQKCPDRAEDCQRYHWTRAEEQEYLKTGELPANAVRYIRSVPRFRSRSQSRSPSRRRSPSRHVGLKSPGPREPLSYPPRKSHLDRGHSSASEASDGEFRRDDRKESRWAHQMGGDILPPPPPLEHLNSPDSGRSNVSDGEVLEEVASAKIEPDSGVASFTTTVLELEPPAISPGTQEGLNALETVLERPASPGSRLLAMAMQSFDTADMGAKVAAGLTNVSSVSSEDKRPAVKSGGAGWPAAMQSYDTANVGPKVAPGLAEAPGVRGGDKRPMRAQGSSWPVGMQSFDAATRGTKVAAGLTEAPSVIGGDKRPVGLQGGSWPVGLLARSSGDGPLEAAHPAGKSAVERQGERVLAGGKGGQPPAAGSKREVREDGHVSANLQNEGARKKGQPRPIEGLGSASNMGTKHGQAVAHKSAGPHVPSTIRLKVSLPNVNRGPVGTSPAGPAEGPVSPPGGAKAATGPGKWGPAMDAQKKTQPSQDSTLRPTASLVSKEESVYKAGVNKVALPTGQVLPDKMKGAVGKPVAKLSQRVAASSDSLLHPVAEHRVAERRVADVKGSQAEVGPKQTGSKSTTQSKQHDSAAKPAAASNLISPEKARGQDKALSKKTAAPKGVVNKPGVKEPVAPTVKEKQTAAAPKAAEAKGALDPPVIKRVIIVKKSGTTTAAGSSIPSLSAASSPSKKAALEKGAPKAAAVAVLAGKKLGRGLSADPALLSGDNSSRPPSRPSSPAAQLLQSPKVQPASPSASARLLHSPAKPQTLPAWLMERSPLVASKLEELFRARKLHPKQLDERLWEQLQRTSDSVVIQCLDDFRERGDQIEPLQAASYLLLQLKKKQASSKKSSTADKGRPASAKPSLQRPAAPKAAGPTSPLYTPTSPAIDSSDVPTAPSTPARTGPPTEPPVHLRNPSLELPVPIKTASSGAAAVQRNGVSMEAEGQRKRSQDIPHRLPVLDDANSGGQPAASQQEELQLEPVPSPRAVGKRSSIGKRLSTGTLSRFGGKELDTLERTGETKEEGSVALKGEGPLKSEEGSRGDVNRPEQGQQRLPPAPVRPIHTEASPEPSGSESSSFSSLFKEEGEEDDDGDEVNGPGPGLVHTARAEGDQWAASGTWENKSREPGGPGHSRKRSAGSIANVESVKRSRVSAEDGPTGHSEEVGPLSAGADVNGPDSKVVNWFKVHLHWEHYPHKLPDGALLKVKATDRYQSTATALLKTLEIIYRVEVSRSTWAEQQSPRNLLAELQLTSAKTKVTISEPKGMAKKFYIIDDEGRKYWSNIKRGSTHPNQHHLASVLQHDLTVLGLCPQLVTIEWTLGKKQAGSLLQNMAPCTCLDKPAAAPLLPMSPKSKVRIGSPPVRDHLLGPLVAEEGVSAGGAKKRKNVKKGANKVHKAADAAAVPTLDSPAPLSPNSLKKRMGRPLSKKGLASPLAMPGEPPGTFPEAEAGTEWLPEDHEQLAPLDVEEKSADQAAFWEEIKGNVKSRELQNLSSVLVAGKRRRGT